MGGLFIRLLNVALDKSNGLLKEANLFASGEFSSFEFETFDGTYKVTISKKDEDEKDA